MTDIARMLVMVGTVALLAGCSNLIPGSLGGGFPGGGRASDQAEDMAALPDESAAAEEAEEAEDAGAPEAPVEPGTLGQTVASLGNPAEPGLWLETPLVTSETPGRITTEGGASADVTLRPSGGAAGSGSRISLAAMQALGVSLTDLVTLTVTAGL